MSSSPRVTPSEKRRRAEDARVIGDVLRRAIDAGETTGQLDERELVGEFGASRNAVRDALANLRAEGLIERTPRAGTHVVNRKAPHGLDALRGLKETLSGHGQVRNEVRVATLVRAPGAVARRLRLADGAEVVYIERLRLLDDEPVSLDLTYLVADLGIPILGHDLENTDVFALLEEVSGKRLHSADHTVNAAALDPHSAATLEVAAGSPALLVERLTSLGPEARPVDLEYIRLRGDRISLHATATRDQPVAQTPGDHR
ncbi:GntR family transcriptional regulator [Gordonia sp. X0973]|uniref:GntR family transcriptional regulator n=1 Tax=Gordonia sp. X0973 TaxID=2742602 RepID=UPI000F523EBD|nr:GntR family transcriptional regulator [Gordonia sp. X0973]QKT06305.1 GntR family transcriptional regulator [Gordonia sp. X0973]